MNILFLTLQSFDSINENGIYTDLLREFSKNNHTVCIISPTERRMKESTKLSINDNVRLLKLKIGNIQKTNLVEKGISMLMLEVRYKSAIKKYFSNVKFDLIIYSTPPVTLYSAIGYVKTRDTAKTYLLLKDIFPQNAVDLGMLKNKGYKSLIYKYFREKEKKLYEISNYIGCMSKKNKEYIISNNSLDSTKIEVNPNSIEPKTMNLTSSKRESILNKYGIPKQKDIFIYGGNIGKPQGINFLIECLKANEKSKNAFVIIIGSGTEFNRLNLFFEKESLKNSKLIKELPKNEYETMVNACDVGLIFLDSKFTIPNIPSRILSYMQASIPILAATDTSTDLGEIIRDGDFGFWCKTGDLDGFVELVEILGEKKIREKLGNNGRKYLENNYTSNETYKIIMDHFD